MCALQFFGTSNFKRDDGESNTGWDTAGFVRTNNLVPQRFFLRLIVFGDELEVVDIPLDARNHGEIVLPSTEKLVLVVAAAADSTTEATDYTYFLQPFHPRSHSAEPAPIL